MNSLPLLHMNEDDKKAEALWNPYFGPSLERDCERWYVELWCCRCCCNYLHRNATKRYESHIQLQNSNLLKKMHLHPHAGSQLDLGSQLWLCLYRCCCGPLRHWMKSPETENCCSVLLLINTIELFSDYLSKKYAYWLNFTHPESQPSCECQLPQTTWYPLGDMTNTLRHQPGLRKKSRSVWDAQDFAQKIRAVIVDVGITRFSWAWHRVRVCPLALCTVPSSFTSFIDHIVVALLAFSSFPATRIFQSVLLDTQRRTDGPLLWPVGVKIKLTEKHLEIQLFPLFFSDEKWCSGIMMTQLQQIIILSVGKFWLPQILFPSLKSLCGTRPSSLIWDGLIKRERSLPFAVCCALPAFCRLGRMRKLRCH